MVPHLRHVVVATHGHCFDGLASAVLFTKLYLTIGASSATTFSYRACDYGPDKNELAESTWQGDENALLDYRYAPSPRLTWYFDHHETAFATPEARLFYDNNASIQGAYDAAYPSCTQLIFDHAVQRYGISLPELDELISWANLIDTAAFSDPEAAVRRDSPVLHLMTVMEHQGNSALLQTLVPRLLAEPLQALASSHDIVQRYQPLAEKRRRAVAQMQTKLTTAGCVAVCDLADEPTEVVEKFTPYMVFPDSVYAVIVFRTHRKIKVSVGYNPWSHQPRRHNIGAICMRYGGGGHPVVGAFTFPVAQLPEARSIAAHVIDELQRDAPEDSAGG